MQLGEKTEKEQPLENYCVRRALWTGAAILRWRIPIGQLGTIGGGQHNRHKRHNNRRRPAQAYCFCILYSPHTHRPGDTDSHKHKYTDIRTEIRHRHRQTHVKIHTINFRFSDHSFSCYMADDIVLIGSKVIEFSDKAVTFPCHLWQHNRCWWSSVTMKDDWSRNATDTCDESDKG